MLQKNIKSKNDKIKGYRDIIIRLKEEFIKLEEDTAVAAASMKDKMSVKNKERDSDGGPGSGIRGKDEGLNDQAMKELRGQIAALRDGLRLAKEDLEKARQTREKLNSARQAAQEESDRLESQVGRAEAQAAASQEALGRARKELEETRKREIRLRDKLKEIVDVDGPGGGSAGSIGGLGNKVKEGREAILRIEQLERETEILRAQNLVLRKSAMEDDGPVGRSDQRALQSVLTLKNCS